MQIYRHQQQEQREETKSNTFELEFSIITSTHIQKYMGRIENDNNKNTQHNTNFNDQTGLYVAKG